MLHIECQWNLEAGYWSTKILDEHEERREETNSDYFGSGEQEQENKLRSQGT
jgi:hypothetical protein